MTDSTSEPRRTEIMLGLDWWFSGKILRPLRIVTSALMITSGPWIVFVLTLVAVGATLEPVLGRSGLEDLRLTVIYAFCVAPLAAGPVGVVAARLIEERSGRSDDGAVAGIFLAAIVLSAAASEVLSLLLCLALPLQEAEAALSFMVLTAATAAFWVTFAVLSGNHAYRLMLGSFSFGMLCSLLLILSEGLLGPTVEGIVWSFAAGLMICVGLTLRVVLRGGFAGEGFRTAPRLLAAGLQAHWPAALGVLLTLCGVWIDKWALWFGPDGVRSQAGFLHFGKYDSVMFVAHLSMIPSLAMMFLFHDGLLTERVRKFHVALRRHATHALIQDAMRQLQEAVMGSLARIIFVQIVVAAILVLLAPVIARNLDFTFAQFLTLRIGIVGVSLYSVTYLNCTILLLAGKSRSFVLVQAIMFLVNLLASLVEISARGWSAYPFFIAALVTALISSIFAERSLRRFDYLIFVGENSALNGAPRRRQRV